MALATYDMLMLGVLVSSDSTVGSGRGLPGRWRRWRPFSAVTLWPTGIGSRWRLDSVGRRGDVVCAMVVLYMRQFAGDLVSLSFGVAAD